MSLHAQLSPEVIERLRAQKRQNTVSSIIIGLLAVVVLALLTGLFMIPIKEKPPEITIYTPAFEKKKPDRIKPPIKRPMKLERKPTPPRQASLKPLIAETITEVSVPVPVIAMEVPDMQFGTDNNFGDNFGPTPNFDNVPPILDNVPGKRCSERDRRQRLRETGGTMEGERAVIKALDWLQETQNEDGSWGDKYQSAMTGFALLAYLGHCETPESRKYGNTVSKGMTYLIDLGLKNDGKLTVSPLGGHQWVYEHAIATYALAEAQTFCKQLRIPFPNLEKVTRDAGEIILKGQADSGSWNYRYANNATQGDNSVGFWQMQALKACQYTGLWPDAKFKRPMRKAVEFLEKVQGQNGAIGYRLDPNRSPHLTGGAILCMQIWDEGDSKAAEKATEWVRKNSTFEWGQNSANLYYHYYNAQAMINTGGDTWKWYNEMFRDQLIEAQREDGSWKQKMAHGPINDHMATCLATLTLEVYYRFLPSAKN